MKSDRSTIATVLGMIVAGPVGFILGILSFREYQRYQDERMMEEELMVGGPPVEIETIGSPEMENQFHKIKCGMCGTPNEVLKESDEFECRGCGQINEVD